MGVEHMRGFSNEIILKRTLTLSDFTLRYHKRGITALQVIKAPSVSNVPVLLSGDNYGYFVMWDLVTKRPITHIEIEGNSHIIAFWWVETTNVLYILSKDSMLRIFELDSSTQRSIDLVRKLSQANKTDHLQWTKIYEMPINTLNFANFIIEAEVKPTKDNKSYRFVCCHTDDSETIDIYQIIEDSTFKLKRPFNNINFPRFLKQQNFLGISKDSKFGIIMRFAKLNDVIFLAYENGFVVGFKITFDEGLQRDIAELVHVSNDHYPNPILDMCVSGDELYSCSTDDFITKYKIPVNLQLETKYLRDDALLIKCPSSLRVSEPSKVHLPLKNIGHIDKVKDDYLVVSSWSGMTIVYNMRTSEVEQTFVKSKNNLVVSDSSMGDLTNGSGSNTESSSKSHNYKVGAMTCLESFDVQSDGLRLGQLRRIKALAKCNWCLIGYEDGTIKLNKI
ncbi:BMC_2a_G0056340.mRNA.1.CDS.1 [Saccharomyces cerevisiae]|nr:BMC_2a_G0056340.mRNA.1.CDS.1 [Saccharomyces cerevisiae]CAI4790467.1 BMB_G0056310.mRNA.1.CDS.1 [Saccharomyces cerevisiae]CAI7347488.1 BMC_2a_G0056340.mRNA.1.CDS.1 [Saccharomyces cerevisiae]CAI7350541.1 BMB_G0056310.mRNA.1.CDS.1 [Saccharomyces cerevisiae]